MFFQKEGRRNSEPDTGTKRQENIIIALEIIFFSLIAVCFYSGYTGYKAVVFIEFALIIGVLAASIYLWHAERDVSLQLFWLSLIFLLIWTAGILCKESRKENMLLIIGGWISFLVGTMSFGISLLRSGAWKNIGGYKAVILICIIFAILSLGTLDEMPMYDSGAYYSWNITKLAPNFDFTPGNISDYCLADHTAVGYGIFVLLGELLSPHTSVGVHAINILLAIISVAAFYKSLKLLFPHRSELVIALATGVYAFAPNMLGLVGTINTDVPGIYFFVILWYCYLKGYRALELFFAWVFICMKEPNAVYYAFFVMGIALVEIYNKKISLFSVKNLVKIIRLNIVRIIPLIFWVLYYIAPDRNSYYASSQSLFSSDGIHTFGFSMENLVVKLEEIFIFNCSWLFSLFILISIGLAIIGKKKLISLDKLFPLISALIGVFAFNIFYLDHPHPRYISMGIMVFAVISILLLLSADKAAVRNIGLGSGMIILMVQSFITIDPLTYMIFPTLNRSGSSFGIITTGSYRLDDAAIYNREYSGWEEVLNQILQRGEFDSDSVIVFPGYENIPRLYSYGDIMHWNTKKMRIQPYASEDTIPIVTAKDDAQMNAYNKILYIVPFYDCPDDIIANESDRVTETFKAEYGTMSAECYVVR